MNVIQQSRNQAINNHEFNNPTQLLLKQYTPRPLQYVTNSSHHTININKHGQRLTQPGLQLRCTCRHSKSPCSSLVVVANGSRSCLFDRRSAAPNVSVSLSRKRCPPHSTVGLLMKRSERRVSAVSLSPARSIRLQFSTVTEQEARTLLRRHSETRRTGRQTPNVSLCRCAVPHRC